MRAYNPGLITAVALFLPIGLYALIVVSGAPGVGIMDHMIALSLAILIHIAIFVHVKRRVARIGKPVRQ